MNKTILFVAIGVVAFYMLTRKRGAVGATNASISASQINHPTQTQNAIDGAAASIISAGGDSISNWLTGE